MVATGLKNMEISGVLDLPEFLEEKKTYCLYCVFHNVFFDIIVEFSLISFGSLPIFF